MTARLVLLLATAVTLPTAGCQRAAATPPAPPPPLVEVAEISASAPTGTLRAPGVLARRVETPLAFRTGGIVTAVTVREGEPVRRGQRLATLALDEIDARVRQARSALDKARRDLGRAENLHADRVATLEMVQDARTGVEQAEATVTIAEFTRRHSVIVAPGDGVVLRRLAEPGQEIAPGAPVLEVALAADGWVFRAGLAQVDAARVATGDRAEIAFPGRATVTGGVTRTLEATDPVTRTTTVEVELRTVPDGLRSGDVGTLSLVRAAAAGQPSVPLSALVEGDAQAGWVFLFDPATSTVRRVQVETAGLAGDRVVLATPLEAGARVVVSGAEYLRDGARVRLAGTGASR